MIVHNFGELFHVLTQVAVAGDEVLIDGGPYKVTQTLVVPVGVKVRGNGVMSIGSNGVATALSTTTHLIADEALEENMIELGDGSSLHQLKIEDVAGRRGNPVVLTSSGSSSTSSASIEECEVLNPNPADAGPVGRAILVWSQKKSHPHSKLELMVRRCRVISTGPCLFAINFSADSHISLQIEQCSLSGILDLVGGASVPAPVSGSSVRVRSRNNLYKAVDPRTAATGWQICGGSNPPGVEGARGTRNNGLVMDSDGDVIEGYDWAIDACGGSRPGPYGDQVTSNSAELILSNLRVSAKVRDFVLRAARSGAADLTPGDNNTLLLTVNQVRGSDHDSAFDNTMTMPGDPLNPNAVGTGNRLTITGALKDFKANTRQITPLPAARLFAG